MNKILALVVISTIFFSPLSYSYEELSENLAQEASAKWGSKVEWLYCSYLEAGKKELGGAGLSYRCAQSFSGLLKAQRNNVDGSHQFIITTPAEKYRVISLEAGIVFLMFLKTDSENIIAQEGGGTDYFGARGNIVLPASFVNYIPSSFSTGAFTNRQGTIKLFTFGLGFGLVNIPSFQQATMTIREI